MSLMRLLGIAKPIPGALPPPSCGLVAARVGIPITSPPMSTRAPAELPGLIAALVWITEGNVTNEMDLRIYVEPDLGKHPYAYCTF
jgi:hypothetical protein